MNIRDKMDELLKGGNYLEVFEGMIDGRQHGILQTKSGMKIIVVYKSKDDIDDHGNPITKVMEYDNLKDLLGDFQLIK